MTSPNNTVATSASTTSSEIVSAPHTHVVDVGARGKLIFSPNSVNAAVGDIIHFRFLALNHTLTQSTLLNPCVLSENFDTEFTHFNPSNRTDDTLMYLVQSTNPQWFFCRQLRRSSHCAAGMVFGLNPGKQMDEFMDNAQRAVPLPMTAENSAFTTQSEIKVLTAQPSTNRVPASRQTTQLQSELPPVQVASTLESSSKKIPSLITSLILLMPLEITLSPPPGTLPSTGTPTTPPPITTSTSSTETLSVSIPTVAVSVVSRDEKILLSPFFSGAARDRPSIDWYAAVLLAVIVARRLVNSAV
jgi:hypothetical protein